MTQREPAPDRGGLVRVRLDVGYDGTGFAGWAVQPGPRTVQGVLEEALGRVLRLDPAPALTVAGRTDAGVHARGQVCHVDLPEPAWDALPGRTDRPPGESLVHRLAGVLPRDLRVRAAGVAPTGFDARFSAIRRRYAYRVSDAPWGVDPLRRFDVLDHRRPLDAGAMNAAAPGLLGEHDFVAYCRPRSGASTVRAIQELGWTRQGDGLLVASFVADAFCHHLVRALVGALLAVGEGRRSVEWPAQVLQARRRDGAVTVAPPHGLTLEEVVYPPDAELGERARVARRRRRSDVT